MKLLFPGGTVFLFYVFTSHGWPSHLTIVCKHIIPAIAPS